MAIVAARPPRSSWQVYAVQFAHHTMRRSEFFPRHHDYGEPDGDLDLAYYLWVIRGPDTTIVVDTGFDPEVGHRRGRHVLVDPIVALGGLGIDAATVATVIITHAHFDHIGNLPRFSAAQVIMSRREFDFWQSPFAQRGHFSGPSEPNEVAHLRRLQAQGKITLIDDFAELFSPDFRRCEAHDSADMGVDVR